MRCVETAYSWHYIRWGVSQGMKELLSPEYTSVLTVILRAGGGIGPGSEGAGETATLLLDHGR